MKKFLSRKFILAVILIILSGILCYCNKINASQFMGFVTLAFGVYTGANVIQGKNDGTAN